MRKPYYFSQKRAWYVKVQTPAGRYRAVRLHEDEQQAYAIWQRMLQAGTSLSHPRVTVAALVDAWLSEHKLELTEQRYRAVGGYLGRFIDGIGPDTVASEVTKGQVREWVERQQREFRHKPPRPWTDSAKRDAVGAVKRVFAWAHTEGHLLRNQLAEMRMRKPKPRTKTVTAEEHLQLLDAARQQKQNGRQFCLYLIASQCGARPQQIREVTPENVHPSGKCWVFTRHKTADSTGKPLVVYLPPCLETLTKILTAQRNPGERLFRQENG